MLHGIKCVIKLSEISSFEMIYAHFINEGSISYTTLSQYVFLSKTTKESVEDCHRHIVILNTVYT